MMRQLKYILFLFLFISSTVEAQHNYLTTRGNDRHFKSNRILHPLFHWFTGDYTKQGIQFSFGPTYTLTNLHSNDGQTHRNSSDTTVQYSIMPKSRLGAFVELGMTHIVSRPSRSIHYFDWGIGFKYIGGAQTTSGGIMVNNHLQKKLNGKAQFYNGYLYGRFGVHSVFQLNRYCFIDNSLGINGDYAIKVGNRSYDGFHVPVNERFQEDINVQLHYILGFGIKPNPKKGFFFIPSIELPIVGIYHWHGGTPSLHWFSSSYYPIALRLRFVFLIKKGPNCPTVISNEGKSGRFQKIH